MKTVTITTKYVEDEEMAYIYIGRECVYSGNYWDFHSGCSGTEVAGYKLEGLWDNGIESLAGILKLLKEKDGYKVTMKVVRK